MNTLPHTPVAGPGGALRGEAPGAPGARAATGTEGDAGAARFDPRPRGLPSLIRRQADIRAECTVSGTNDYVGLISGIDAVARRHIHESVDRRAAS